MNEKTPQTPENQSFLLPREPQKGPWKPVVKGRPRLKVDERMILHMAKRQNPVSAIASVMGCDEMTLRRHYMPIIERGWEEGKAHIRDAQWRSMDNGSWRAQEWLGIQHLGQRSRFDEETKPTSFTVNVLAVPTRDKVVEVVTKSQNNIEDIPMDKQINKVKKDVEKNDKPKAKKDIKKLLKMDKKFDAKLDKCDKMKKGSK